MEGSWPGVTPEEGRRVGQDKSCAIHASRKISAQPLESLRINPLGVAHVWQGVLPWSGIGGEAGWSGTGWQRGAGSQE